MNGFPSFFAAVGAYATGRVNGSIDMWMWAETPDGRPYTSGYTILVGTDNLDEIARNLFVRYPRAVKITLWQQNTGAQTSHERCNYAIGEWVRDVSEVLL